MKELESKDLIQEQAFLVSRGVRPMAIVGNCSEDKDEALEAIIRLETFSVPGAIPFITKREEGILDYGFASEEWVIDLFSWVNNWEDLTITEEHRHQILGLLLGYGPDSIRNIKKWEEEEEQNYENTNTRTNAVN